MISYILLRAVTCIFRCYGIRKFDNPRALTLMDFQMLQFQCLASVLGLYVMEAIVDSAASHFAGRGLDVWAFTPYTDRATWSRLQGVEAPLETDSLFPSSAKPQTPSKNPDPILPPPPGLPTPSKHTPSSSSNAPTLQRTRMQRTSNLGGQSKQQQQ